jgi:flagellar hook-length control protein FliK
MAGTDGAAGLAGSRLAEQVTPALVRHARLALAGGDGAFTMRLQPEALGTLHVRVAQAAGGLAVELAATSVEARQALEAALPELQATLADAGVRLERLNVGLHGGSSGAGDGRGWGGWGGAFNRRQGEGGRRDAPGGAESESQAGGEFGQWLAQQAV